MGLLFGLADRLAVSVFFFLLTVFFAAAGLIYETQGITQEFMYE